MRGRLLVDLDAVSANWQALDRLTGPLVETGAVVKADAYGLGIAPVARALVKAGAGRFFVALADEGAVLRAAIGAGPDIFVFSGFDGGEIATFRDARLIPLLNSATQIRDFAEGMPGQVCGIQVDSGMNRLGLEPAELLEMIAQIRALEPCLMISHLACADTPSHAQNSEQLSAFLAMAEEFPGVCLSLAATGGILLGLDFHFGMTRPGIGLFGGLPFADSLPVVSLELPVIQTRVVQAGESVGYGADWVARAETTVATVSAGYADGILRSAGGKARLFAGDVPCPVLGRISMDMISVDVSAVARPPRHLTLLGPHQNIDQLARDCDTIAYEILTSLGARYERVYKGG